MGIASNNRYIHGASGLGGLAKYFGVLSTKTLAQRVSDIGSAVAVLEIYSQETITADLSIPGNITVIMKPGSKITVSGDSVELYIAKCICESGGPHFSIGSGAWLIFGTVFQAPSEPMFEGSGMANVRFGLGPQLIDELDRRFSRTGSWTLPSGWSIGSGLLTADGNGTGIASWPLGLTAGASETFWIYSKVTSVTAGQTHISAGNAATAYITAAGSYEDISNGANNNNLSVFSYYNDTIPKFAGSFDYISCRKVLGSDLELKPEWWGAIPNSNTDCTAAFNAAVAAASAGWRNVIAVPTKAIPNVIRLANARYHVKGKIQAMPWVTFKGSGISSRIKCLSDFSSPDDKSLIKIGATGDGAGGVTAGYGFTSTGDRPKHLFMEDITLDGSALASGGPWYLMLIANHFGGCEMNRVRFLGNNNKNVPVFAIHYVGGVVNINSTHFRSLHVKDCYVPHPYPGSSPSSSVGGAMNFLHSPDCQHVVIREGNFNNSGVSILLGGANNLLRDNNFEAKPNKAGRVMYRGELIYNISAITKGVVTTISYTEDMDIETGQCIYITGITQANWSSINGIHKVTKLSNVKQFTIPVDSSGWANFSDTGQFEWVGGQIFRVELYGNRQVLENNYFDGYGMTLKSMVNANVVGTTCTFSSRENIGISAVDRAAEVISTGSAWEMQYYTGAMNGTAKNQVKFTGQNLTNVFLVNNYMWTYQYSDVDYGYIRSKITNCQLSGSDTIVTLQDQILRSDTTIRAAVEPTNWQGNRFIQWRGSILAKPTGSL